MSTVLTKIPKICCSVRLSLDRITVRGLSLQEHVALTILNQHKIKTPRFGVAKTPNEADKIARDLLTKNLTLKAQVMADGRDTGHFSNCYKGGVHSAIR
jgi:succinyl-CoA synthetase beta subunit